MKNYVEQIRESFRKEFKNNRTMAEATEKQQPMERIEGKNTICIICNN